MLVCGFKRESPTLTGAMCASSRDVLMAACEWLATYIATCQAGEVVMIHDVGARCCQQGAVVQRHLRKRLVWNCLEAMARLQCHVLFRANTS
jgi:hypothetical protein